MKLIRQCKNNITRIQYAAAQNATLGYAIMASNPVRLIAYVQPDGSVIYKQLIVDAIGNVTIGNIFTP